VQARTEANVVARALERATDLATLTANYAWSGQGLPSDAEMAAVQPALWSNGAPSQTNARSRPMRLLHLDPGVALAPAEDDLTGERYGWFVPSVSVTPC
jgi:hypothetical protein